MGIADLIPGVSGGTIALIVGIYPKLIATLANLHPRQLLLLRSGKINVFLRETNDIVFFELISSVITFFFLSLIFNKSLIKEYSLPDISFFKEEILKFSSTKNTKLLDFFFKKLLL